ncbi:MAG: sulfite exporter TauE/SafE family protein [Thermoplasmata archaeon]|nr:sulfite exporter TauE/SafE family protein [Thermoplasmata archaeon]
MFLELVLLLAAIAVAAGLVGSLAGIGGGLVLVPVLVVFLQVPFPEAVGASALTIIATSTTAGATYVEDRLTNVRVGMLLEVATVPGAFVGAALTIVATRSGLTALLLVALGVLLLATLPGALSRLRAEPPAAPTPDDLSRRWRLGGSYFDRQLHRSVEYHGGRTRPAFGIMFGAGIIAGLFGIGGGVLKVLALDRALGLPVKVATATSNFMIGVTAAAGVALLVGAGYVDPVLAAPLVVGSVVGSYAGTRILPGLSNRSVRLVFVPILVAFAFGLIFRGILGWA